MRPNIVLLVVIVVLAVSNLLVSSLLGLGDAEALYYCYGQNLSLSYLDHPPLLGWLIAASVGFLGENVLAVRAVSLLMTTFCTVFVFFQTREMFGDKAASWAVLLMLATPVFSVGMVAAAPDAPLAAAWCAFVWQLYRAVADQRKTPWSRIGRPLLLGFLLGLAFLSKYTGALLVLTTLAVVWFGGREWLRRPGFWLGLVVATAMTVPVWVWNVTNDWAGLKHRLIWTQGTAGFSLRNLGALLGGQLLYLGPFVAAFFGCSLYELFVERRTHKKYLVLFWATVPALILTYTLVAWSDVAEPHWPAAGYLALYPMAGALVTRTEKGARRLARYAIVFGMLVLIALHVVVLTPLLPSTMPSGSYQPEFDLGNELRGWPEVARQIRGFRPRPKMVVAGFYTQCSQLAFALSSEDDPKVRCVSKEIDDFDIWYGSATIPDEGALFVTDNRFKHRVSDLIPGFRALTPPTVLEIMRGGRWARRFKLSWLIRDKRRRDEKTDTMAPAKRSL